MGEKEKALRIAFHQLEKSYRPYIDYLVEKQDFYPEFKGAVTIDCFLVHKPKLLILSYNPGTGKYNEHEKNGAHLANYGERPTGVFEWGNARKNGNWWETDNKKINNDFPANVIEFLYAYTDSERGSKEKIMDLQNSIMFLNLYPIATEDINSYKKMLTKLLKDKEFQKAECFNESWRNEWDIRLHLLGKIHEFIETYVQPENTLCLGRSTIEDYLWEKKHIAVVEDGIFRSRNNPHIYGISRSGNWKERARRVAKIIGK